MQRKSVTCLVMATLPEAAVHAGEGVFRYP